MVDASWRIREDGPVNYETFRTEFEQALLRSKLAMIGTEPAEVLDLRSMARTVTVNLTPALHDAKAKLRIGAVVSFTWDALHVARTTTSEGDAVRELLGDKAEEADTEQPWLRIDTKLRATTDWGKGLPLPATPAWRSFATACGDRIDLTGKGDGDLPVWQGDPEVSVGVTASKGPLLEALTLPAFVGLHLPRQWNDSGRKEDPHPRRQLAGVFARAVRGLVTWRNLVDQLVKPSR